MDRIKYICIENIKGISKFEFNNLLLPNNLSIFVASNGYGKSSLALAFSKLNSRKLMLEDEEYHYKDKDKQPSIKIEYEQTGSLKFNNKVNEISNKANVLVLKNGLYAKAVRYSYDKKVYAKSSLAVKDIEIATIPPKTPFIYSFTELRKRVGKNGKVFLNLDIHLKNPKFVSSLRQTQKYFDDIKDSSKIQKEIKSLLEYINSLNGTIEKNFK